MSRMTIKIIRMVSLLALAIGAMFLIGYLYEKKTENEPTWAADDKDIVWEKKDLPRTVFIDESFGRAHIKSAEKAVKEWNDSTCVMMVRTYELEHADIHVRHEPCDKDADKQPNHPGCAWLNPRTGQIVIQVGQPGDVTMSYLIFLHEFTHGWGLAHDGIYKVPAKPEDSRMFVPITANNAHEHAYRLGTGFHLPRLSDRDQSAVKKRYCE